jgi:hypothetical protein
VTDTPNVKLLFPDACWTRELISGALFLYFHNEKLTFTLHPSVSTFLTGIDPFDFMRFVEERSPSWQSKFSMFIRTWKHYQANLRQTFDVLEPLRGTAFNTILMSYPRGSLAWQSAQDLIESSELGRSEMAKIIDPFSASDELFSHIFFEMYLELYEHHSSVKDAIAPGAGMHRREEAGGPAQVDWRALYDYCAARFGAADLEEILITAYMFRLPVLRARLAFLLTNQRLIRFLASLPLQAEPSPIGNIDDNDFDVIAWEFFRQLVSPPLDPLEKKTVRKIMRLIQRNSVAIVLPKTLAQSATLRCYRSESHNTFEQKWKEMFKRYCPLAKRLSMNFLIRSSQMRRHGSE